MSTTIRPCRFCGETCKPRYDRDHLAIRCAGCLVQGPSGYRREPRVIGESFAERDAKLERRAIEDWNLMMSPGDSK